MQLQQIAEKKPATGISPSIVKFFESHARLSGLVREIYIARGWIKVTDYAEAHYQITPLGARMLQVENQ